ncbi:MAG TPA: hypothetical protein PKW35_15760 [Nannocystaceae bacterium]|nr:hypothetical protein [Nannocystaceae bacterium]
MRHALVAFLTGILFAVGLAVSGMTRPDKVRGFLDITGDWDPSLTLVMGGAVFVFFFAFRMITRRPAPLLGGKFGIPSRRDLDPALLGGAALFGIGWGLGGFCPGPALTSITAGSAPVLTFVAAMLVGMVAHTLYARARA